MRRYAITVFIILLTLLWVGLATAQSDSVASIPYVYRIDIKGCKFAPVNRRQTGFRVQGLEGIVTALHGVADCTTIHATTDGGQEIFTDLEIQQVDIERDVAILGSPELAKLPPDGLMVSPLSRTEILSTTLHIAGYPLGLEKQDIDVIEKIRDIESLDDVIPDAEEPADFIKRKSPSLNISVLNVQAQLLPGHSGAPLLDNENRVVAIGNGGLRGGSAGRSWAILWDANNLQSVDQDEVRQRLTELAAKDIAALAFSSTFPSQVDNTIAHETYTVQIIDADRNQSIGNAEVLLTHSAGYEIGVTDSEGFYSFRLSSHHDFNYEQSQIQVEASGYELYNRNILNIFDRANPEKIRLTAIKPTAPATQFCQFAIRIIDQDFEPIRGARVKVLYGLEFVEDFTNSDGEYRGELLCDQQNPLVSVEVSARSYETIEKNYRLYNNLVRIQLNNLIPFSNTPTMTSTPTIPPIPSSFVTATRTIVSASIPTPTPIGTVSPATTPMPFPSVEVRSSTLNVRAGPGVNYASLTSVSRGQILPVIGQTNNCSWFQIRYNGTEGWVSGGSQFVSLNGSCNSVQVVIIPPTQVLTSTPMRVSITPANQPTCTGNNITRQSPTNSSLSDEVIFAWTTNFSITPPQKYELVFWKEGENAFDNGFNPAGGASDATFVTVNLNKVSNLSIGQNYRWGVLLVELPDGGPYHRKCYLGGDYPFTVSSISDAPQTRNTPVTPPKN